MAIVSKTLPKGVDTVIEAIQQYIYPNLLGEGWTDYVSYPRANKNPDGNNTIPEISSPGSITEYTEVLFNDKHNATSFFLVSDETNLDRDEQFIERDISMIFQVKLPKLFASVTDHRADEEMHQQILQLMNDNEQLFIGDISYITGIDNVYGGLDLANYNKDGVNLDDMSEFHVVRFDFTVNYDADDCNINFAPTCDPVAIELNGVFSHNQLPGTSYNCVSGGASIDIDINGSSYVAGQAANIDIPVVDTAGNPKGTVDPGVDVEIADSNVSNSDDSYSVNVLSEVNLELLDNNYEVFLDGVSQGVQSGPSMKDQVININWV